MKIKRYGPDDILRFGKHSGHQLKNVIRFDPYYIDWCILNLSNFFIDPQTYINLNKKNYPYHAIEKLPLQELLNKAETFYGSSMTIEPHEYSSLSDEEQSYRDAFDGNAEAQWNID